MAWNGPLGPPVKTALQQSAVGSNNAKPQLHSIAFHPGRISKGQSQFFFFFLAEVWLIDNAVLVSSVQQRDSVV